MNFKKSQHERHSKHVGFARGLKRGDQSGGSAKEVAVVWKSEAGGSHGVPGSRCHVLPVPWGPRDSCTATCGTGFIPGLSLVLIHCFPPVCPRSDPSPGAGDVLVMKCCRHYLLPYFSPNKHHSHLFINHFSNSKETSVQIRN